MSEKSLKHTHKKPGTPLGRLNHEFLDYVIYTFDIHKVERVEKMHKSVDAEEAIQLILVLTLKAVPNNALQCC